MTVDPFAPVEGREVFFAEFIGVRKKKADEKLDPTSNLMGIRQIARSHYVMARTSLVLGYSISGCLLAQQATEMYVKGLIVAHGGFAPKDHDLTAMVATGYKLNVPALVSIAKNEDEMKLLKGLCLAYDTLRFSEEAGYIVAAKNTLLFVDQIVFALEQAFSEKLGEKTIPRLYVNENLKERFLKLNDYWTSETVSNNSGAMMAENSPDLQELPPADARKRFTWITCWAIGPLTRNMRIGSIVKKVAKEEEGKVEGVASNVRLS